MEQSKQQGFPGSITQFASVLVRGGEPGREFLVIGQTQGGKAGTPQEWTKTSITVIAAPEGKAQAIFDASLRLPPSPPPSQQWLDADKRYYDMRQQQQIQEQAQLNAQIQKDTQNILNMGQNNIQEIQQKGAVRHQDWVDHENQTGYHGQQTVDRINGDSHSYCYEDNYGHRQWTAAAAPPASSYHPCRN